MKACDKCGWEERDSFGRCIPCDREAKYGVSVGPLLTHEEFKKLQKFFDEQKR